MSILRFEDLIVWQEARKLTCDIYKVFTTNHDMGFRDQIQRAAVSIVNNIAEGFERNGNKEFAKFLWIAKGSAGEVISQFYTALDIGYVTGEQVAQVSEQARHCTYLIYKFIQSLKTATISGERYKTPQTPQPPQTSHTPQTSRTSQTPRHRRNCRDPSAPPRRISGPPSPVRSALGRACHRSPWNGRGSRQS